MSIRKVKATHDDLLLRYAFWQFGGFLLVVQSEWDSRAAVRDLHNSLMIVFYLRFAARQFKQIGFLFFSETSLKSLRAQWQLVVTVSEAANRRPKQVAEYELITLKKGSMTV